MTKGILGFSPFAFGLLLFLIKGKPDLSLFHTNRQVYFPRAQTLTSVSLSFCSLLSSTHPPISSTGKSQIADSFCLISNWITTDLSVWFFVWTVWPPWIPDWASLGHWICNTVPSRNYYGALEQNPDAPFAVAVLLAVMVIDSSQL